jgi:hypothetical protein
MKIVITESQYSVLTRRYASSIPIEELVGTYLNFLGVKKSETFDDFYSKVKKHVMFRIKHDMLMKDILDTTDYVNRELNDLVEKIENDVHSYIDDNLKDKIEDYYNKHSKKTRNKKSNLDEDDGDHETIIDLDTPVDFSTVGSISDLATSVKKSGLKHGKGSVSRERGVQLSSLLKSIGNLEDRQVYEKYFLKLSELISKYKSSSFSLKKLVEMIEQIQLKNPEEAKTQMESIITIFEDPKFGEKYKKKLILLITGREKIDLDDFYKQTKLAYQQYEDSFVEGNSTPFVLNRTSPRITVLMAENLILNGIKIYANEFNSITSDVLKIIYIIKKISETKYNSSAENIVRQVFSNIKFRITFNFDPKNVKADLYLKDNLIYNNNIVADEGTNIEVKYNPYNTPYYLSEFMKIDSTTKSEDFIKNALSVLSKINDLNTCFKTLMESLSTNLHSTVKKSIGNEIIEHLVKDLSGMIFKDSIFVKKEDISFYWNTVGYAKKSRLSVFYKVKENAKLYKITKTEDGYTNQLENINLQESIKRVIKQETELTERCWKGYTQKGMKTMFGKRYPNCVKIKK